MLSDNTNLLNIPPERSIYCNRTLNMRSIKAIGYDMDYTLIHYLVEKWEETAYSQLKKRMLDMGWNISDLEFDPNLVIRGLLIDKELGNLVKTNRFGYVKKAFHGINPISYEDQRKLYDRVVTDTREPRWAYLTTLFNLSEGCMYAQLVDKLDRGELTSNEEEQRTMTYSKLQEITRSQLNVAHAEGMIKDKILKDPASYVFEDVDTVTALMEQKASGKKLLLITNSDWDYTREIMKITFNHLLPEGMKWRDLFDFVIVAARKPYFFSQQQPIFEIVDEEKGLLQPVVGKMEEGKLYLGGYADLVENALGFEGSEILYVGDHIESDVRVSKKIFRWRTALVLRELEGEIETIHSFHADQQKLTQLMEQKNLLEYEREKLRSCLNNPDCISLKEGVTIQDIEKRLSDLRRDLLQLDDNIIPLAKKAQALLNDRWGLITRSGYDKSFFARQMENSADIYMSRVSNFAYFTPNTYFRSTRSSLPHDGGIPGGQHPEEPKILD